MDKAVIKYKEALYIEKIRNRFFKKINEILGKIIDD